MAEFWQLIWQERSPAVVMLTKTYELIKVMSACYWPIFVDKKEELEFFGFYSYIQNTIKMFSLHNYIIVHVMALAIQNISKLEHPNEY